MSNDEEYCARCDSMRIGILCHVCIIKDRIYIESQLAKGVKKEDIKLPKRYICDEEYNSE